MLPVNRKSEERTQMSLSPTTITPSFRTGVAASLLIFLCACQDEPDEAPEPAIDNDNVTATGAVGDRKTLKVDAYVPAALAAIFLVLLLYFRSVGGYRRVSIVAASQQRS